MKMRKISIDRAMKNVQKSMRRSLRDLPFGARRRSTPVLSYVLGAIGIAVVGGIAAVMAFSPRTRFRALDLAKDTVGKVEGKIGHTAIGEKLGMHRPSISNGLSSAREQTSPDYPSTGI